MDRLPPALRTAYVNLRDALLDPSLAAVQPAGNFVVKTVKGRRYWYRQTTGWDGRQVQSYVGSETPELLAGIARHRALRDAARERRDLVRALVRSGAAPAPGTRLGRILEALADAGVFRRRAVLIGTLAYQTYGPLLGVRLGSTARLTECLNLVRFRSITLAVEERLPPLLDTLRTVEPDVRLVTDAFQDGSPIGYRTERRVGSGHQEAVKLQLLAPLRELDVGAPGVPLTSGIGAQSRPFLDLLLEGSQKAVVLHGAGVPVTVPDPVRFALHRLILSQRRSDPAKARKDLWQAETLLAVLAEECPLALAECWEDLRVRGPAWRALAASGLAAIAPRVRDTVRCLVYAGS